VVLQVGEDVVHDARDEGNGFLLLITAVHHVQERRQNLQERTERQTVCAYVYIKGISAEWLREERWFIHTHTCAHTHTNPTSARRASAWTL